MLNQLQRDILRLKKEKNAIILAHNYQSRDIQEIADFKGDSLELCIEASRIEGKDIVVFCGVDFMAETAYILNPDKKILIPDRGAECPMAHMLSAEDVRMARKRYPDAAVVLYVNTLAEAKAEADILCTSSNAVRVVKSLDEDLILFGPDRNLGWYVQQHTDKTIIPLPEEGHCYVHKMFTAGDVMTAKEKYPEAELLIHPECDPEVQELADHILSTGGMLRRVLESDKKTIPLLEEAICENMKLHTLEKVKNSLIKEEFVVTVPDEIARRARRAVERMIEVST